MASFNQVILMGNLTKDPELSYTYSGVAVVKASLAVNYRTGKGDQAKDECDFFDIEAWDKTAELISEHYSKGSPIHFVGRMKQDRWTDDNGKQRSRVKVVVSSIQFLPRGEKKDDGGAPPAGDGSPF